MTNVYLIRHAESDYSIRDSMVRPLTEKGITDCALVTEFLSTQNIDVIFSSPYKRAVDTLCEFAQANSLEIHTVDGFGEIKMNSGEIKKMNFPHLCSDFGMILITGCPAANPPQNVRHVILPLCKKSWSGIKGKIS